MTKKYILIFILGLIILNIFPLKSFYYNLSGNIDYDKGLYIDSINKFEKANNIYGIYNKANSLYKNRKYIESIKEYLSILSEDKTDINYKIYHNIGNSYYRIGELENDKVLYWDKSVEYYNKALDIKYDEETKDNLEFVLKKIKEEKDKKDDKDEENKSEESNKENGREGKNKQKNEDNKDGENKENGQEGDKKKDSETKSGDISEKDKKEGDKSGEEGQKGAENSKDEGNENKMSENQEKALEQYQEALKEEERNNQDGFNKVYQEQRSNDPFERLFNNGLLDNNTGEKDW